MVYVTNNQINIDENFGYKIPNSIMGGVSIKRYRKGETLFTTGDPVEYLYIIQSGMVQIFEEKPSGDTGRVVILQEGELIGEMEVISSYKKLIYSAEIAKDDTEIIRIPPQAFNKWLEMDQQFCLKVVRMLSDKMYETAFWLNQYSGKDSLTTVMNYIYETSRRPLEKQKIFRNIDTRLKIAESCRLSERTVNRRVSELADKGVISIHCGKIQITRKQLQKLKEMIENEKSNIGL